MPIGRAIAIGIAIAIATAANERHCALLNSFFTSSFANLARDIVVIESGVEIGSA